MESDFFYDESLEGTIPTLFHRSLQKVAELMNDWERQSFSNICIPSEVSNALLAQMRAMNSLDSKMIGLFGQQFKLTEVDISYCKLTYVAFEVLSKHLIRRLSLRETKGPTDEALDLHSLFSMLDHRSITSLEYLNISGRRSLANISSVSKLNYLSSLIVSQCIEFGDEELELICNKLSFLQFLDISQTSVTSIEPLLIISNNLKVLVMHRLLAMNGVMVNGACKTLRQLRKLTLLDVSDKRIDVVPNSIGEPQVIDLGTLLVRDIVSEGCNWWPNLRSLDIAGSALNFQGTNSACSYIDMFIELHPLLEYISILDTSLNRHAYQYPYCREKPLQIANGGTRTQCLLALQRYWRADRETFAAHALQAVYYMLQSSYDEFQTADLRLAVRGVVLSMGNHLSNIAIQMAGSACLYHLCKLKRTDNLTTAETRQCVERCLGAAEKHPEMVQLQKNVWLTMCNDHLLQTQTFNMFQTCEVALEAMVNTRDPSVSRMTIAIVSILAPKIPTTQSHRLATNQRYVGYLIQMIRESSSAPDAPEGNFNNFTVKFTLSALWNLTDESPETCRLFVQLGGLDAALDVLDRFSDNANIQTKVLGLLNNVAEVKNLQGTLLQTRCVQTVLELLDSDLNDNDLYINHSRRLDVSYFAAGILSNLLLCRKWSFDPSPDCCNTALMNAVRRWPKPILTMVAYRSFAPFFALLERDDLAGAQMWAAWAIQHVCINDKQNGYLKLLVSQGGYCAVRRLVDSPVANLEAVKLAQSILDLLNANTDDL